MGKVSTQTSTCTPSNGNTCHIPGCRRQNPERYGEKPQSSQLQFAGRHCMPPLTTIATRACATCLPASLHPQHGTHARQTCRGTGLQAFLPTVEPAGLHVSGRIQHTGLCGHCDAACKRKHLRDVARPFAAPTYCSKAITLCSKAITDACQIHTLCHPGHQDDTSDTNKRGPWALQLKHASSCISMSCVAQSIFTPLQA